jgi:Putative adhesin
MFSSQENEPQGQQERQANTDPREQNDENQVPPQSDASADSSYEQGYRGYDMHTEGEKLRPSATISSKQWIWIIVVVLGLLVLGGTILDSIIGSVFILAALAGAAYVIWRLAFNQAVQLPMHSFEVAGRPDLIVDNPFGAIRIHRGSANIVEVRGTRYYSSLFPSRPSYPLNITQQEKHVKVEVWSPQVRRAFTPGDFGRIDLDIFTPALSDVHVRSDASSITVDGINGQAIIRTNAGTIDIKNASLVNRTFVHTNAGTINVQNVNLDGGARMETNAGTISFSGSINPGDHYSFETNAGTIDMALPANTAFILDAKTDLGTVSNQFGSYSVGAGPQATLHLHTHLGTISVKPSW